MAAHGPVCLCSHDNSWCLFLPFGPCLWELKVCLRAGTLHSDWTHCVVHLSWQITGFDSVDDESKHSGHMFSSKSPQQKTNQQQQQQQQRLYSHFLYVCVSIYSCMKCGLWTMHKWVETSKRPKTQDHLQGDQALLGHRAKPHCPAMLHWDGDEWLDPTKTIQLEIMGHLWSQVHKSKRDFSVLVLL